MEKEEIFFGDFINSVDSNYQNFIGNMHEYLLANGCKSNIEQKRSGYFISYAFIKSKKSIANFLFRKKGLIIRIYGENVKKYSEFLNTLPDEMVKSIEKSPVCKRLINPNECSPKCSKGYDFIIKEEHFQKCRTNCFMFDVSNENNAYIRSFVENEIRERSTVK